MNSQLIHTLRDTVELINANLDTAPDSWRDQLQAIRNITATTSELTGEIYEETSRLWQVSFVDVAQRVAFADADNGPIADVADWCLRQLLALLASYPDDVEILSCELSLHFLVLWLTVTVIGRNWLLRAQKALASIARAEDGPFDSDESSPCSYSSPSQAATRLNDAHHVEAQGLLLPATDYLQRAVDAARGQGTLTGSLLLEVGGALLSTLAATADDAKAAEAFMSLGNVTSSRVHHDYFRRAISHLRAARAIEAYSLPLHMQQYLDEYGVMYDEDWG